MANAFWQNTNNLRRIASPVNRGQIPSTSTAEAVPTPPRYIHPPAFVFSLFRISEKPLVGYVSACGLPKADVKSLQLTESLTTIQPRMRKSILKSLLFQNNPFPQCSLWLRNTIIKVAVIRDMNHSSVDAPSVPLSFFFFRR